MSKLNKPEEENKIVQIPLWIFIGSGETPNKTAVYETHDFRSQCVLRLIKFISKRQGFYASTHLKIRQDIYFTLT